MGLPGQGSEVHTISAEMQVLQREDPVRPRSALPLDPCVPAPREKWLGPQCPLHRRETQAWEVEQAPRVHVKFRSDPVPPASACPVLPLPDDLGSLLHCVPHFTLLTLSFYLYLLNTVEK